MRSWTSSNRSSNKLERKDVDMNAPIELVSHLLQTTGFATWFLDALLKSLVVLSAAGGLCLCWRRASAATRHWIWFLAVASLPCLPLSSALSPSWQRPLWSVSAGSGSGNQISLAIELVPIRTSSVANPEMPAVPPGIPRAGTASSARHLSAHISSTKLAFAVTAWGVGTVLMLAWIVAGQWQLARMSRSTRMVEESEWTSLLAESRERLGLRRRVNLRRSRENLMPMTWGWWRPVLLLPADADTWPAERRRVVLLHELAHVKRWDCLTQLITRIVCALYWFNPLVWVAARRMCVERERACDDQVLNGGWKASDYASHLVEIARSLRRVPQAVAIAMARSSQLGGRVAALVDATRSRRLRSATALAILLGAGAITLCLGGSRASTASSSTAESDLLRQQQIARLQAFSAAKEQQSRTLAAGAGETRVSAVLQRGNPRRLADGNQHVREFQKTSPAVRTKARHCGRRPA
jgi:beta-lactamase regulating signal transducer with metallopeptidase domain